MPGLLPAARLRGRAVPLLERLLACLLIMTKHIAACRKCGSTTFFVHESYTWLGTLDEYGLGCTNPDTQIDEINCERCGESYTDADFAAVNFD